MNNVKKSSFIHYLMCLLICVGMNLSYAQTGKDYPNRPIRLIAPFAAGSNSDTSARFVASQLSIALGQSVNVENLPGADGRLGMVAAKNQPADGYTLVQGSWTNLAVNVVLIKNMPYDPLKDFKPLVSNGRSMLGIAVSGNSPIKTFADLLAAAKKEPRKMNFGNFGMGYRLAAEWFSSLAGVQFTHVPYKTTSQMNTDLVGAQIDAGMDGVTSMSALVKSGQLRMLAVTGDSRHPDFPNVPTVKETFPEFSMYGWSALMIRADTPEDISNKLAETLFKIMGSSEAKAFAQKVNSELLQRGPVEMRKYQVDQIAL
ncbi:MAG: tripartite tricarboxylate transporter substrate binding protein, partial [Burkholderiaceae bacterium]